MSAALWDEEGRAAIMAGAFKVGHHYPANWQRSVGREMTKFVRPEDHLARKRWGEEATGYWRASGTHEKQTIATGAQGRIALTMRGNGDMTTIDIAKELGRDTKVIGDMLSNMRHRGFVERVGTYHEARRVFGVWRLVDGVEVEGDAEIPSDIGRQERAERIALMRDCGISVKQIAEQEGCTATRIRQLIARARG